MRVLLVSGIFPPDIGGPATHAAEIRVGAPRAGPRRRDGVAHRCAARDHRATASSASRAAAAGSRRDARTLAWIVRRARRFDVIYATGLAPVAVAAGRLARAPGDPQDRRRRRLGARVAARSHARQLRSLSGLQVGRTATPSDARGPQLVGPARDRRRRAERAPRALDPEVGAAAAASRSCPTARASVVTAERHRAAPRRRLGSAVRRTARRRQAGRSPHRAVAELESATPRDRRRRPGARPTAVARVASRRARPRLVRGRSRPRAGARARCDAPTPWCSRAVTRAFRTSCSKPSFPARRSSRRPAGGVGEVLTDETDGLLVSDATPDGFASRVRAPRAATRLCSRACARARRRPDASGASSAAPTGWRRSMRATAKPPLAVFVATGADADPAARRRRAQVRAPRPAHPDRDRVPGDPRRDLEARRRNGRRPAAAPHARARHGALLQRRARRRARHRRRAPANRDRVPEPVRGLRRPRAAEAPAAAASTAGADRAARRLAHRDPPLRKLASPLRLAARPTASGCGRCGTRIACGP